MGDVGHFLIVRGVTCWRTIVAQLFEKQKDLLRVMASELFAFNSSFHALCLPELIRITHPEVAAFGRTQVQKLMQHCAKRERMASSWTVPGHDRVIHIKVDTF